MMTGKTAVSVPNTDPSRARPASRSVLVADDDDLNRQLTRRILEARGWSVAAVGDGETALACATRRRFDLVLLDVEMPGLDGPQVAARLRDREQPGGERMTLFALTSHRDPAERRRCLEAGMDGYLTKPLEPAELERLLAGNGRPTAGESAGPQSDGAGVDWQGALAAAGGDHELLEQLTATARKEVGGRLAALRRAVAAADSEEARRAAHSLRGALRIFGAGAAREAAHSLEKLAARNRLGAAGEPLARLATALDEVLATLAAGPPPGATTPEG